MTASEPRADAPRLQDDVRLLGQLLGDWIRERHGQTCFDQVEAVRGLAKRARAGQPGAAEELATTLHGLDDARARVIARSFAHFLGLANIAEQQDRVRRRALPANGGTGLRGSLDELFARAEKEGISPSDVRDQVLAMRLELVMTAHPTEVNRRTLLQRHRRIAELLGRRETEEPGSPAETAIIAEMRREIVLSWEMDDILRRKPTPLEEANAGLLVFEQTLWAAVPEFARTLNDTLLERAGEGLPLGSFPFRFGSWMGGDRDGNPNVTAAMTRRSLALARWMAADLYWHEIDALRAELAVESASPELFERAGMGPEPYRRFLGQVRDRLAQSRTRNERLAQGKEADTEEGYACAGDFAADLRLVRDSLLETGLEVLAEGRIEDLLRRIDAFGLTLVRLDIREESERHDQVMDAITSALGLGSWLSWDEASRRRWLVSELANPRPLVPRDLEPSDEVGETFRTLAVLADSDPEGLGAYVISMARSANDVLVVELLQKEAGVAQPLRVVPLFETLADLQAAGEILTDLLAEPGYRARLAARGNRMEVMVGYSDSSKDAGLLAASWGLFQAQEAMHEAARAAGVELVIFHGRGGSVGRGGASAHEAITSLPPGTLRGALRVTEQGEIIQAKFGLPGIALRTLELYLSAVGEGTLLKVDQPKTAWREMMDRLAERAASSYRAIVREDPRFVPYFRAVTPEPELGGLNIGSRPARRRASGGVESSRASGGVESLRAIPWQFAWTQTRLLLPSWLGIGEALRAALDDAADRPVLEEMAAEWPYFRTFLDLVEMVLAKAEPGIHAIYEELLGADTESELGADLAQRFRLTRAAVLELTGADHPLAGRPELAHSLALRNPYVDPINILQAEILRRYRKQPSPELEDALLITINGIAAGMRNTG